MPTPPHVLVVRTGRPSAAVDRVHGDFSAWFGRLLAPRAALDVADATAPLPSAHRYDGIVVTGSLASVTERAPWMSALAHWALSAGARRPVLGVCFGHQLLGRALGARIERNPRGPDGGTRTVTLTQAGTADPLFAGLPASFLAPEAHEDHVAATPPGARLLASSPRTPVEAFGVGTWIRGVQFHPEFDPSRARASLIAGHRMLERGRAGGTSTALASVRPTPFAERVLANWLEAFVGAR